MWRERLQGGVSNASNANCRLEAALNVSEYTGKAILEREQNGE
jgi:hypothetical protein